MIAGVVVGLFVGYAFGKYKGASEVSEGLDLEEEISEAKGGKPERVVSPPDAESSQMVFIRRGGRHYHREVCPHLRRRGQPLTKAAAIKNGFRRCPSCRP